MPNYVLRVYGYYWTGAIVPQHTPPTPPTTPLPELAGLQRLCRALLCFALFACFFLIGHLQAIRAHGAYTRPRMELLAPLSTFTFVYVLAGAHVVF